ncbi:MAG TPA: PKD domain-containing protein [Thermoplasmata archaeon]|nr:PKD domain-containing protein [Thermoplasmata archaeon]
MAARATVGWAMGAAAIVLLLSVPGGVGQGHPGVASPTPPGPASTLGMEQPTHLPLTKLDRGATLPHPSGARASPESTDWPMFLHDMARTGANPAERTIASANVSDLGWTWQYNTSGAVSSSVAVVNETAYFGSWDGHLYAVNARNGSLEWRTSLGGTADYTGCGEPGIASTPIVWNGTVYIGGGNPWEYAVSASNGSILWHLDLANVSGSSTPWTAHKIWSSAAVYNGSLYVGIASGCDSPLVRGALFQVALSDHTLEHVFWTLPAGQIGPGIWSSPSIDPGTNTVWITTGNEGSTDTKYARSVVELNASNISQVLGYAQRSVAFQDLDFGDGATLFHSSSGTPMVVAVNKNGVAYAFNQSALHANGSSPDAWTLQLTAYAGNTVVPPAFDGRTLYFGTPATVLPGGSYVAGSVLAVNPDNGSVEWWVGTTSEVYAGLTYIPGCVVASLTGGGVDVFDAATGTVLYSRTGSSSWGEPIVVDGELLVTSGDIYGGSTGGGSVESLSLPFSGRLSATPLAAGPDSTFQLSATAAGGVPPYSARWTVSDGRLLNGTSAVLISTTAGTLIVNGTIEDARGSTVTASFRLVSFSPLVASPSLSTNPVALGGSTYLNLSVRGGESPFTITWSGLPAGVNVPNSSADSLVFIPVTEGTYNVSATVSSSSSQSTVARFAELWVDGPSTYTIAAAPSEGVLPLLVHFTAVSGFPGAPGSYAWQFGDGAFSSQSAPTHVYTVAGAFPVTLKVPYGGGAVATAAAVVFAFDPLALSTGPPQMIDLGQRVSLTANATGGAGAYTYRWTGLPTGCVGENTSILTCVPTASGAWTSSVRVTDPIGGELDSVEAVIVNPPVVVIPGVQAFGDTSCTSPSVSVTVGGSISGGAPPYEVTWSGPNNTSRSGVNVVWSIPVSGPTNLTVQVTDTLNQTVSRELSVQPTPPSCASAPAVGVSPWTWGGVGVVVIVGVSVAVLLARRRKTPPLGDSD